MLQIGWIDFSKEHRNKVMSVLDMLTKPGAVDELGIAVIRDRFSDIFFPGTSTIQTRAKYFLIVPWLLSELEKEKGLSPFQFARKLHNEEIKLIYVLERDGSGGVIGTDSREKLKRKPSEIYWNGIRTFGIFKYPKLTLAEYMSVACKMREANEQRKQELKIEDKDNKNDKDDKDAFGSGSLGAFWSIIKPQENWKNEVLMDLTAEEAQFLKDKITTSPFSKDSLMAYILRSFGTSVLQNDSFEGLAPIIKYMPDQIQRDYIMARDFERLIFGAHIRYNLLFFKAMGTESDYAISIWEDWKSQIKEFDFKTWDNEELFTRVKVYDYRLRSFIRAWTGYAQDVEGNLDKIDELIINREIALKGPGRSKLKNTDEITNYNQEWIGIGKLEYRWPSARRILRDIVEGLGDNNA